MSDSSSGLSVKNESDCECLMECELFKLLNQYFNGGNSCVLIGVEWFWSLGFKKEIPQLAIKPLN